MSIRFLRRRRVRSVGGSGTLARRAVALLATRVGLVVAVTVAVWWVMRLWGVSASFPPSPTFAALSLLPVSLASLYLTSRLLRAEGQRLRDLFAPGPGGWARDVAWGVLWLAVLYLPFSLAVLATMWVLHGGNVFAAFETAFYDPDAAVTVAPGWLLVLGIITVATFVPFNAPAEEAVYRGYAQSRLSRVWSVPLAVVVGSLAFGFQHIFFAPTRDAMAVYFVAFTVWGLGSALIVHKQGRLLPVTVAHFFVNLATTLPAVVLPVLLLRGVLPQ